LQCKILCVVFLQNVVQCRVFAKCQREQDFEHFTTHY
jgi:hypothetical protein